MRPLMNLALSATLLLGLSQWSVAAAAPGNEPAAKAEKKELKDIVDTAVAAGNFKTLAKALEAADLVTTLKGKAPLRSLRQPTKPLPSCPPERSTRS